jgi:hypothetical protein
MEFAADGFADFLFQEFSNSLDSQAGHKSKGLMDYWMDESMSR